jgi:hypothetical protein
MLKWLKRLMFFVFCIALLCGAAWGGGLLLPSEARLERTISVDAEAEHIYPLFNTVEGLSSFWTKSGKRTFDDFQVKHTGGPEEGEGLELSFTADGRSMGTQTIRKTTKDLEVVYDVDYGTIPVLNARFTLTRTITLDAIGPITSITWAETATLKEPPLRYLAIFTENTVEEEIGAALDEVKAVAEPAAVAARAVAAETAAREKAAAAEKAAAEEAQRIADKAQADEAWEYTQEEAPTPIDMEQVKPTTKKK